jgi:non-heme chloroperoxidase
MQTFGRISTRCRRAFFVRGAALFGAVALAKVRAEARAANFISAPDEKEGLSMGSITTRDGARIYYKDWGTGQPVVFSHGWPLTSDAWEDAMFFLASNGYRCIGADRRGHGRSSQPWNGNDLDTYADDLAALSKALNLQDAIYIGHSTGGGEVARYIGRHGSQRVAAAVLVSDITPSMLRTPANPDGVPLAALQDIGAGVLKDRAQYFKDLSAPFYGANRPESKVSDGLREFFYTQSMMASMPASYACGKILAEADLNEDIRKIDVPTLIVHGGDDQLVPLASSALRSSKIIRQAKLIIYDGAPHGLPSTHKDRLHADLLAFVGSVPKKMSLAC